MNSKNKIVKYLFFSAFFILPAAFCFAFYFFVVRKPIVERNTSIYVKLPYFGPKTVNETKDTIYYSSPEFILMDQTGNAFGVEQLNGKMYVASFLTTYEKTTGPKLSAHFLYAMKKIAHIKDVHLLSFMLDSEADSLSVLDYYSYEIHSDPKKWNLLTGPPDTIRQMAFNNYLLKDKEYVKSNDGKMIASKWMVLVDKERHIRGYYDGTITSDVNRLIDEIKVLNAAYTMKDKSNIQQP